MPEIFVKLFTRNGRSDFEVEPVFHQRLDTRTDLLELTCGECGLNVVDGVVVAFVVVTAAAAAAVVAVAVVVVVHLHEVSVHKHATPTRFLFFFRIVGLPSNISLLFLSPVLLAQSLEHRFSLGLSRNSPGMQRLSLALPDCFVLF